MLLSTFVIAVLAAGPVEPPVMRIPAADLDLSDPRQAAVFADRVVEESRRFCAIHVERITPEHPTDIRRCERGMSEAAVRALPEDRRQRFVVARGPGRLYRRLR